MEFFKYIVEHGYAVVTTAFAVSFTVLLFVFFIKAARHADMTDLFRDKHKGYISHTKFWSNVAFLAATIAFLNININDKASAELWAIYLGTVASQTLISKFIGAKYKSDDKTTTSE